MIEQPRRQAGPQQAKRFHAVCPNCTRLLIIVEGKFPEHMTPPVQRSGGLWGIPTVHPPERCLQSEKEHTNEQR